MTDKEHSGTREDLAESLEQLDIAKETVSQDSSADGAAAPETANEPENCGGCTSNSVDADHLVDHALRDALSRNKHRESVLRLEKEVEEFVINSTEPQLLFASEASSYERLLMHRTAQHWGLDTTTVSQGPNHGRIVAVRTPRSGPPQMKLADLPVVMDDQVPAPQGPAPRLLVRKKNERNGRHASNGESSPYGNGQGPYPQRPGMPPIEDRELHYEKARARIFGEGGMPMQGYPQQPGAAMMAYPYGVGMAPMSPVSPRAIPGAPGPGPFPAGPMPQRSSGGPSGPPMHRGNDRGMERNDRSGGGYSGGGGGGGGGRGKAQLRNRQEDMSDPDFRRGRLGPRFDPGFGEDAPHGGMYYHPTYSSEFPTLATGPAGVHDAPSPRGGGAAGYSGNGASAGAMGYAGGYPPAMLAAPMGQYGYGQGMMAPGMVPVAMGSNGLGGMPMYQGGGMAYPGAYMTPMGPYGYIPMRPGPDGMVPHGVMPMPMHGGAYMQNGMGGVPMSPTAAGMAGLPSPGSNKGRSRRNGTGSRGSSSAANTPRAASLPSPARQSSQQSTDLIAAVAEEGAR